MNNIIFNSNFTFDSRKVLQDGVFIALSTGVRDGNDFAKDAFNAGANFLILGKEPNFKIPSSQYVVVPDTLQFICDLAKQKFQTLKKNGVKTVSITGSVGKTTTKDLIIYTLKKAGKNVYGTQGNFNNHIGVPITILNTPIESEFLVLEMGMNHLLEIENLVNLADTDIRIITNIEDNHIQNFDEGLLGIAKAKAEILCNSTEKTVFFTRQDLNFLLEVQKSFKGNTFFAYTPSSYEIKHGNTYFEICGVKYKLQGIVTQNWLYSVSFSHLVAEFFKLPPPPLLDLNDFEIPKGRGSTTKLSENSFLIDESYNAGSASMYNLIERVKLHYGKKLLILGGMKELGSENFTTHKEVLLKAISLPDTIVVTVGPEFKEVKIALKLSVLHFETPEDLIEEYTLEKVEKYNFVFVKSSNASLLSKFVNSIIN